MPMGACCDIARPHCVHECYIMPEEITIMPLIGCLRRPELTFCSQI